MRASQIGLLVFRLIAVATLLYFVPRAVQQVLYLFLAEPSRAERGTYLALALGQALIALVAVLIWFGARRLASCLSTDDEPDERLRIDGAQFFANGAALIAIFGLMYAASSLRYSLAQAWAERDYRPSFLENLLGGGGVDGPLIAVLSLALLLFAPRLGIWIENASFSEEATDERPRTP